MIHTKLMQIQFHASTTVSFLSKFMNAECQASIEIIENQFFRFRQFAFFYLKKKLIEYLYYNNNKNMIEMENSLQKHQIFRRI